MFILTVMHIIEFGHYPFCKIIDINFRVQGAKASIFFMGWGLWYESPTKIVFGGCRRAKPPKPNFWFYTWNNEFLMPLCFCFYLSLLFTFFVCFPSSFVPFLTCSFFPLFIIFPHGKYFPNRMEVRKGKKI